MEVAFSSGFKRAYKKVIKKNPESEKRFWERLGLFINDPYNRALKTHKLSGNLSDLWSFSVEYDVRVIFYFLEDDEKAVFVDIGRHDDVY